MTEIRTFICFELPPAVKDELKKVQDTLRPLITGVSWVKPEGIHLTLKFLGQVPLEQIEAIGAALHDAAKGFSAITMRLQGLGAFPSLKRPRVYWAGIEEASGELAELQEKVEEALTALGFAKEDRPFSPHLTLGRVKKFDRGQQQAEAFVQVRLQPLAFTVHELVLMKSDLKPSGAEYTALKKFPLR